jgi:hypothetical protein
MSHAKYFAGITTIWAPSNMIAVMIMPFKSLRKHVYIYMNFRGGTQKPIPIRTYMGSDNCTKNGLEGSTSRLTTVSTHGSAALHTKNQDLNSIFDEIMIS